MSKKILFGICGSVSAFKTVNLIRLFIKDGYTCRAILTKGGQNFVKPELLTALGCKVYIDESLDMLDYAQAMSHINLSRWADEIIIVPASANTITKISLGLADDLLTQMLLACGDYTKVSIAPAMNVNMWQNILTQQNIKKLKQLGYKIIEPKDGLQACGDIGGGRLAEPEQLFEMFQQHQDFKGKRILITVGATVEDIDGVRFISNYSSGKMGLSLVKELLKRGAFVTVLKGNTSVDFQLRNDSLNIISTKSALDMNEEMLVQANSHNIFIACAAVADYRIKEKFDNKIKKTSDSDGLTLEFVKNPDILKNCKQSFPQIFAVGFAAESQKLEEYALDKLQRKNLDMIVANNISVLGKDNSSVTIFSKGGEKISLENVAKQQVAKNILDMVKENYEN